MPPQVEPEGLAGLGEDEEESPFAPPVAGAPVLPVGCDLTEEEVRARMQAEVEPASAEEYLMRVRVESMAIPKVVRARNVISEAMPRKRHAGEWAPPPPLHASTQFKLSETERQAIVDAYCWARDTLLGWDLQLVEHPDFLKRLPSPGFPQRQERLQWMDYLFGNGAEIKGKPPLLHILLQMDFVVTVRVLRCLTKACELTQQVQDKHAAWMFALLARMDIEAITVDVAALLSSLHRLATTLQSRVQDKSDPALPGLSALCVVLEDVFGQGDDRE